jgi:hypothetical protein
MTKLEMLTRAPLTAPPSTAGNSLFGKTADLRAIIEKIRVIEAAQPGMARFKAPAIPSGNLCSKKDMETARRHLAVIAHKAPAKASLLQSAPAIAQAPTKATAANVGRTALELLALDPGAQNEVIFSALPLESKQVRDELRAAYASASAGLRTKFAATFHNALAAHEPELAPSISKQAFDRLTARQKSDTCRAGIRITN